MKAWPYESIQDFLVSQGFSIDQDQYQFTKWRTGWECVRIPFDELAGHTVATFRDKALRRGWLLTEENKSDAQ